MQEIVDKLTKVAPAIHVEPVGFGWSVEGWEQQDKALRLYESELTCRLVQLCHAS